ncbi:hypothetical protein ANCCAN_20224 [Ancylostoma caninum]|uniref:Uncharacterized protein n=1 Tax=Ancylostoma caninum TaxID=29170 RepID=A0A368FT07_ANCCA|nr:hypothetical protein ANCCAN_20224 [Ancylostoma caninum]
MSACCVISGCLYNSECFWRHFNSFLCLYWNCPSGSFVRLLFPSIYNHDDSSDEAVPQSRRRIYASTCGGETKSILT